MLFYVLMLLCFLMAVFGLVGGLVIISSIIYKGLGCFRFLGFFLFPVFRLGAKFRGLWLTFGVGRYNIIILGLGCRSMGCFYALGVFLDLGQ